MARKVFYGFILAAAVIAAIGCEQSTKSSSSSTKGTGRLTLNIGIIGASLNEANLSEGTSFTIFPGTTGGALPFSKYNVTLTNKTGGTSPAPLDNITADSIEFYDLATGTYDITVTGLVGAIEAAIGSAEATVNANTNQTVSVTVGPKTGGTAGFLSYNIKAPSGATGELSVYQQDGETLAYSTPSNPQTGNLPFTRTISLAPGFYEVRAVLALGQKTAGLSEVVHIYSNLTSALVKTFAEGDFADLKKVNQFNLTDSFNAPATGGMPQTSFPATSTHPYSGTIAWTTGGDTPHTGLFEASKVYQAVVTLTADIGWTFTGVTETAFTYTGATNPVLASDNTGATIKVTVIFPAATDAAPQYGLTVTVGFGGGDIAIGGSDGTNTIYKSGSPNSLTLTPSADAGYTLVRWVVDGTVIFTTSTLTLAASAYTSGAHSVTFIGSKGGQYYSKVIPFTVAATAPAFVAVTDITGVPTTGTAGTAISLSGALIQPEGARAGRTITWAVKTAGAGLSVGAISGTSVTPTAAGSFTLTATVANGKTNGTEDYTQDFTITVSAASGPPSGGGSLEYSGVLGSGVEQTISSSTAWALSVEELPEVVFAVNGVSGTLTPAGTDAARVTVLTSGTWGTETATATRPIVKVNTKDMLFGDSPAKTFTLANGDTTVTVTVDVEPNLTGVAVFKVTADTTPLVAGDEELDRLEPKKLTFTASGPGTFDTATPADNLLSALAWIDMNAVEDTDYLVRLEQNETIPRIWLSCLEQNGVTIRLRGYETERVISPGDTTLKYRNTAVYLANTGGSEYGLLNVGGSKNAQGASPTILANTITLALENNVTLKGRMTTVDDNFYTMVYIGQNSTLAVRDGSKITGHYTTSDTTSSSVIYVDRNGTGANGTSGYFEMTGGEISGNTFNGAGSAVVVSFRAALNASTGTGFPGLFKKSGGEIKNNTNNKVSFNGKVGVDITDNTVSYSVPPWLVE